MAHLGLTVPNRQKDLQVLALRAKNTDSNNLRLNSLLLKVYQTLLQNIGAEDR